MPVVAWPSTVTFLVMISLPVDRLLVTVALAVPLGVTPAFTAPTEVTLMSADRPVLSSVTS